MKKKILVDCDSTLANSTETIFNIWKEETGNKDAKYHNDYLWDFEGLLPQEYVDRALQLFGEDIFYDRLELFPNAYEVLKELSKQYDIAICSVHNVLTVHKKDKFLQERVPFITERIYIPYDGKFNKSSIQGNIIIDDKVSCLEGDREQKILFGNYGYNNIQNVSGHEKKGLLFDNRIVRAEDWNTVGKILL